jgi:two-component system NtrC family sensor kinase
MAAITELASGVGHEINNPLAIIVMRIEMLMDRLRTSEDGGKSDKGVLDQLQSVLNNADRIARIVRSLRMMSASGKHETSRLTPIETIVTSALELVSERMKRHGVAVKSEIQTGLIADCRASEIGQAILGLLQNSLDAVGNTRGAWIELRVQQEEGMIVLSVTDSGSGLPESIRERLMQPFFTTKAEGASKGLGLAVSKGILEAHGGSLRYDPASTNTRFVITLPLAATADSVSHKRAS